MSDDRRRVPPPWSSRTPGRLVVALVTLAVLAFAPVAAALNAPAAGPQTAAPPSPSPTTGGPAPTTVAPSTTSAPPATTATTTPRVSRSSAPTTTTTMTTTGPVAPIDPGPLLAPTPGTYSMKVTVNGTEADGVLRVRSDGTEVRDLPTGTQVDVLQWDDRGAELVRSGGYDATCAWTPPVVVVPAALREGASWSSTTTCTRPTDDGTATITREETAEVTQRARTIYGDGTVDTWLIQRHLLLTVQTERYTSVTEEASSELFAPSLGLPVYRASRTDIPQADGTVESVLMAQELLPS